MVEINQRYEDAIASALALDAGVACDSDLYGRLLAAMLVAGNVAAVRRWIAGNRKQDLSRACLAVVDFAIDHFPARSARAARRLESK
jgi:hypothetical protein